MGFDRKEDFRSSFKEDWKSNEAMKKRRKQGEASHGRAPGCTAVLQHPGLRTAGCTAVRPTVCPSMAVPCPRLARLLVFSGFLFVSWEGFLGAG